ncbi:MAG: cation:proton antiporter [Gammaproteobacteria bacterium]|nr:cation:proton antiporter [Gammaproteobacteria bacterium]
MDLTFIVISLQEAEWLLITFAMGFIAYKLGLPPMLGFLGVGFLLKSTGHESSHELREIADLGVTLMLFIIGLKLNLKSLLRIQIWGVASAHILISILFYSLIFIALSWLQLFSFAELNLSNILLLAFTLSFSSTVFAIKVLESKREMGALYAQIAIGILIIQDIFAVIFLTASTGKPPSLWAPFIIISLPFIRPLLYRIMDQVEHGELLVLYSLLLAIGGAGLFEFMDMKADLGALIFGILLANHPKSKEVASTLYNFKDLFLVAFFINIGLAGDPDTDNLFVAAILTLILLLKTFAYFYLLVKTKLRSRTSFLTSISLANYSEFGLIVGAIAVNNGWISADWLISVAIALTFSFIIASPLNLHAHTIYAKFAEKLRFFQSNDRLTDEKPVSVEGYQNIIFGMGRIGTGLYDDLSQYDTKSTIGIDYDRNIVIKHVSNKRKVLYADTMDQDFWSKINLDDCKVAFLNLPTYEKNEFIINKLKEINFKGEIAAIALYEDEIENLNAAGADSVYNFYSEAGTGFAEHVRQTILQKKND